MRILKNITPHCLRCDVQIIRDKEEQNPYILFNNFCFNCYLKTPTDLLHRIYNKENGVKNI